MSGNKYIALFLFAGMISGCAVSGNKAAKSDSVYITPTHTKKDTLRPPADSLEIYLSREDSLLQIFKDTYQLAVVLPFCLDSMPTDSLWKETKRMNPQSVMSVEFYEGAMLALRNLKSIGLNVAVHVFDSENDPDRTREITLDPVMQSMDLVLGPVYNNDLRVMTEFAKKDSIYMVSPLSPSGKITESNPYYIMVNPTIEVHCKKLFDYIIENFSEQNILIVAQPSSAEWEYSKVFESLLKDYQKKTNDYGVQFKEVIYVPKEIHESEAEEDDEGLKPDLALLKQNIIIVPSVDRTYIHNLSRKLNSYLADYEIIVFGLPVWGDQTLRVDYINRLNVHYTSSYYVPESFYKKSNPVYRFFVDSLQTEPSEYAVKGYDIMYYFGEMMREYGTNFGKEILDHSLEGYHTRFQFGVSPVEAVPFVATTDSIFKNDTLQNRVETDFIENKYVHLLKYEKYDIVEVK